MDCTLTIFCQGPQRDALASRIHALGLNDRVQLAGAVPHAQLMDAFAAADLLVHPSALESFGMVMVEAMPAGLPVVAAASAGARDIVLHDATGLLFPVGDVTGLVASIRRLAQDVALRTTMGTAARQRAQALFSLEAHMRNINPVWNAVVTSPR